MIRHRLLGIAFLLSCITLPGCGGQAPGGLSVLQYLPGGATDVLPGNVVPDPVVDALSIWAYDGRKRQLQKEGKVSDDPQYVEPVTRVFEHIKQAAAQSTYGETAEAFEWEVLVVEDELAYVSVLPGGKVFVHTGIFDLAKNEAGLAAVLGHEAIHALDRHAAQRFTRDLVASLPIGAILTGTAADPDTFDPKLIVPVMAALGMGVYAGVHQPFSRELESEADYGGLLLAASAGYEPEEALVFWIQLVERHEAEYYDTHPASEQRIKDLQDSMDKFQAAYNEAKSKRRPAPLPEFPMTG